MNAKTLVDKYFSCDEVVESATKALAVSLSEQVIRGLGENVDAALKVSSDGQLSVALFLYEYEITVESDFHELFISTLDDVDLDGNGHSEIQRIADALERVVAAIRRKGDSA